MDYYTCTNIKPNFICQGKTLDELATLAKDKSKIAGVSYNEEVLWFVDGEVKKTI
jgi:hypothetical protein